MSLIDFFRLSHLPGIERKKKRIIGNEEDDFSVGIYDYFTMPAYMR